MESVEQAVGPVGKEIKQCFCLSPLGVPKFQDYKIILIYICGPSKSYIVRIIKLIYLCQFSSPFIENRRMLVINKEVQNMVDTFKVPVRFLQEYFNN